MGTFKPPFAYNTGEPISGTTQYGDFVIGNIEVDYGSDYGGVKWWAAPEEITGYVIGNARPGGQPVPPGVTGIANVGFWRSKGRTDEAFLDLANYIGFKNGQPPFTTTNDAKIWLESNGCYTNYVPSTPTPTPTLELTPTVTPTNTSTETQTPTPTNTSTQTQTPTPSITASQTQTPTNTSTQTQTPTPSITASQTQTPTPSITESQTQTPTPSITASQTQTPTPSITASQTQTPTNTSTQTPTTTTTLTATETQTPTVTQTQTQTPTVTQTQTQTPTPTPTVPPIWYQIFDCDNSSTAYSIAYTAGAFANSERCTAVASGFPTRTIIIIGSTITEPGGPLYTLTSQGVSGCLATSTPTPTQTQTPTPTQTGTAAVTPTPTPTQTATVSPLPCECWTVVNEDTVTINYTVINCNGTTISPNILPGDRIKHCIQGGSVILVNSPIGGLLGEYDCGTTCSIANDCPDCGPAPTPTNTSTPTQTPTGTPESTPSPSQASSFTISWTNNSVTTGTNNLKIYKNSSVIVDQNGLGSNSFSVNSGDVITYELTSTTPDFTEVQIIDSVYGTISNCAFNSSSVSRTIGVTYSNNATIDGITTNYIAECP
jgi:hypothetical protein